MHRFRYSIVILTILHYFLLHYQSINWINFSFLLLWLIILQIGWYFVQSEKLKKTILFLALLFSITLSHYNGHPYLFMWLLILTEAFTSISKIEFWLMYSVIIFSCSLQIYTDPNSLNQIILLVLILLGTILHFLRPILNEYQELKTQYYHYQQEKQEQAESTIYLKNHIQTMKDLYIMNERNRISRDIHDSVGHVLSTTIIQLGAISQLTQKSNPQVSQMTHELRDFTQKGLQDIRQIIHQMKPVEFQKISFMVRLEEMLEEFQQLSGIKVFLNYSPAKWQINDKQEAVLYRAIQEFIGNSAKHAQASEIRVNLHYTDQALILNMVDDGVGVDQITPHMGLMGLEERIFSIGGKVNYQSERGRGFKTRIVLNKGGANHESTLGR